MNLTYVLTIAVAVLSQTSGTSQTPQSPRRWFWSEEQATREYSISQLKKPYLASVKQTENGEVIEIENKGKVVVRVPSHVHTTFVVRNDKMFLAKYRVSTTGCHVESFDLKSGKPLWETYLKGIEVIGHSRYTNHVLIQFEKDSLVIYGREAFGNYRERLDPKSGKTLENTVFGKS